LYNALNKLSISIKSDLPIEEQYIQAYLPALVGVSQVNAYDFGGIIAMINIIRAKCNLTNDKQKIIFISHSSKDKAIVQLFVDDVLQLGAGIKPEQIFCTSIEDMGIKNGDDIRKHIHQNIKNADYSFLLISNNYKKSEICLNEMGADCFVFGRMTDEYILLFIIRQIAFCPNYIYHRYYTSKIIRIIDMNNQIKQNITECQNIIEHIRNSINDGNHHLPLSHRFVFPVLPYHKRIHQIHQTWRPNPSLSFHVDI